MGAAVSIALDTGALTPPGPDATQSELILYHLQRFEGLSHYEAVVQYGIVNPAARIMELRRRGYDIATETRTSENGKSYGYYTLVNRRT